MWIWENVSWPEFTYDMQQLQPLLREVIFLQGKLSGRSDTMDTQHQALASVLANIIYSSDIEGEKLDARSVRSSLANHLGISDETPFPTDKHTEGLVESALDAINNLDEPLSIERLLKWHMLLFPAGSGMLDNIDAGRFRQGSVQVVSGRLDKPVIHFEAPDGAKVVPEMEAFVAWFNASRANTSLDLILRAGIAHLWFLTIHPFEDGNGRIGRLIIDLALAQAERSTVRLYAMSQIINEKRTDYYDELERTQRGGLDITGWLFWFMHTLQSAINEALFQVQMTIDKTKYWSRFDQGVLRPEQVKVLNRMLDGDFADGINNRQYMAVGKVSRSSATRHLSELVEHGFLVEGDGGGRSSRYQLNQG
ncbi:Fic family protein [Serratia ficaria]|uniref:Fic family protein n=1 Tax=Serratia ficaria TaxID=61651 RepID=UPI00217AB86F|nr:Fic family protein [Serratia ficaria]CAI1874362.1 Fic/DOC family [Serratia ficaria]